jgi:alpha-1,2-mannosyltransferase
MAGILICAVTGLLVSPVSWSHHWVWVAPALVVLADVAIVRRQLAGSRSRRWRYWLGLGSVAAVAAVFSGVLWSVPAPAVQGHAMTGPDQLIGDLYVLAALISLGVIATLMACTRARAAGRRRDRSAESTRTDFLSA